VAVTELDDRFQQLPPSSAGLQQQATDFTNVVKDCLGVTRCVGVTQWAVGDADSWVPGFFKSPPQGDATMFDMQYNPKPAFAAVQNAFPGGGGNTVTVTPPGNQSTAVNGAVSLQIRATDSAAGQTLTYSSTPLPTGLSLNSSTGLISGTATTAGSTSVTVTVKDGTGATGSASFTWTVGTTTGGSCHVVYTRNSEWPGNFTAQVTITNTSTTAVSGWTLKFTYPGDQKITNDFNGTASMSGEVATLVNASYNGAIAPNGAVTVGFQGTFTSNDTSPTSGFTLNGATCN